MKHRHRYCLLVVRGDGARVFRLSVSRRAALGGVSTVGALVMVMIAVLSGSIQLRDVQGPARQSSAHIADAGAVIASLNRRIAELRQDTAAWQNLHARIWEAIGPEAEMTSRHAGVGGGIASSPSRPTESALTEIDRLAENVQEEGESLRALDRLIARAGKLLAALPSRWPVRGEVNSEFGARPSPWAREREFHAGIDIGALPGTPVHAPARGTVEFAGSHPEYGLTVVIDHGQDIRTVYGHLSQIARRQGQKVERGALVGRIGTTGRSSGPHLHYEILVRGHAVNPRAYLWD